MMTMSLMIMTTTMRVVVVIPFCSLKCLLTGLSASTCFLFYHDKLVFFFFF